MSKGNPRAAVEAWLIATGQGQRVQQLHREGLKRKMFGGRTPIVINDTVATVPRETPEENPKPPLLCFPLRALLQKDPSLPADLHAVDARTLKTHIRPDQTQFLGLFEVPNEPWSGIVVFGPADTPQGVAIQVSQQYRQEQHALESGMAAAQATPPSSIVS